MPPLKKNTVTEKLFQSPSKYIQGPSAIKNAPLYLGRLGKTVLLIADELVYKIGERRGRRTKPSILSRVCSWNGADDSIGGSKNDRPVCQVQRGSLDSGGRASTGNRCTGQGPTGCASHEDELIPCRLNSLSLLEEARPSTLPRPSPTNWASRLPSSRRPLLPTHPAQLSVSCILRTASLISIPSSMRIPRSCWWIPLLSPMLLLGS